MHYFRSLWDSYFRSWTLLYGLFSSCCSTFFLLCRPPNQVLFYLGLSETQLGFWLKQTNEQKTTLLLMKQRPLLPQLLLVFLISGPRLSFPLVFYISLISDCGSCFVFFSQTSQVYPASSYPLFCRHKHTDPLLPHTLSGIHTEYLDYINPSTFIAAFKNILFNI